MKIRNVIHTAASQFLIHSSVVIAITLALQLSLNSALAFNRCKINDTVTYTDVPCPEGSEGTTFTQQIMPPDDPESAKQRHLSNQKELRKLNRAKTVEDNQHKREMKTLAHHIKKDNNKQFKCSDLTLQKKLAVQHYAEVQLKGNNIKTEKARLRAKRAENKYVHYCKS
ncbi:MAG: hypothetical protein K0R08_1277 [Solimicrobium sp.]|jgi:hypothetical protein|nr:hypothetical protein [Solimicrobium sp.]